MKKVAIVLLVLNLIISCKSDEKETEKREVQEFSIEYIDEKGKQIISENAEIEVIGNGFNWTEGPLWIEKEQMLLFSDVPENKIYQWKEGSTVTTYVQPSGFTSDAKHTGEMGSNGLLVNDKGQLIHCQHGNRALAVMEAPLNAPKPNYRNIVDSYEGKRINSPNDVVQSKNGDYFFTDPDYGISANDKKEQTANRVYRLDGKGSLSAVLDTISHPNGLAFSPNEDKLYITNSNPEKAFLYEYQLDKDKKIVSGKIFYDFKPYWKEGLATPDGLKVDADGNIFTSAPGGIWIFDAAGKLLVKIHTTKKSSNCSLSQDGKTIFITNSDKVLRIKMR